MPGSGAVQMLSTPHSRRRRRERRDPLQARRRGASRDDDDAALWRAARDNRVIGTRLDSLFHRQGRAAEPWIYGKGAMG